MNGRRAREIRRSAVDACVEMFGGYPRSDRERQYVKRLARRTRRAYTRNRRATSR